MLVGKSHHFSEPQQMWVSFFSVVCPVGRLVQWEQALDSEPGHLDASSDLFYCAILFRYIPLWVSASLYIIWIQGRNVALHQELQTQTI